MPEIEVWVSIAGEDVFAGTLYSHFRRSIESATFRYAEAYVTRPDAYALDPALPLDLAPHQTPTELSIFNAFSDTAPDRWGRSLMKRTERLRAKESGETARSLGDVDYMLGARDDLRQGALRFRTSPEGPFLATEDSGVPALNELPELLDLASKVENDTAGMEELKRMLRAGSSLGGMRPKSHVRESDGSLAIAKFPSSRFDEWDVIAWEKVALDLAQRAGVAVPRSQLIDVVGQHVLIVTRFDRTNHGERIGYCSALTMLESRNGQQGSYVDIAAKLEEVGASTTPDLHQLWRRMAVSVLISNTDDHLRNHGFLHETGGSWKLSPAFDLNPNPEPGKKHLHTAIDETETEASAELLIDVAPVFRLDEEEAVSILREVYQETREWRNVAGTLGMDAQQIETMEPAFEHAASEFAANLS
jgi:serine/threonine-protein kinase HipA